jgi:NADPH:quinone reductase-like Zn-dependent oxidoreductase
MENMKAAFARGGAGIDSIQVREVPVPAPGVGEVLVRLTAATLNYRDLLIIRGQAPGVKQPDYVPLSCCAGTVVSVGGSITRVKFGDRVSPLYSQGWLTGPIPSMRMLGGPIDGTARQYAVFDAESLCLIPDELGDLDAAALPCAGLTAWSALFGPRPVKPGEWVLLQGTGGVSMAALQWAKAAGAHTIITSSSDAKLRRAKALGADIGINYRAEPDWASAARAARGGRGVDVVVDVVGVAQLEMCASVLAEGGIISGVGRLAGEASRGHDAGKPLANIVVGNRDAHEAMLAFCARFGVRPVIDAVYDLVRLQDAFKDLASGRIFGKVAVNLL